MMESIATFRETLDRYRYLWDAVDVRVLAVLVGDEWHNVLTTCRFVSTTENVFKVRYLPRSARVRSWQEVLTVDRFSSLLAELTTGRLTFGDVDVHYEHRDRFRKEDLRPYETNWDFEEEPTLSPYRRLEGGWRPPKAQEWSRFNFFAWGANLNSVLSEKSIEVRELDAEIHALRTPFDGLLGIAQYVIGLRGSPREWRTELIVYAPIEAKLDRAACRLHAGELRLSVVAGSPKPTGKISIGYIAVGKEELLISDTYEFTADLWTEETGLTAHVSIDMPEADRAFVILRVGDRRVERLELTDYSRQRGNPRATAYESIDPDFEVLRDGLRPEARSDSAIFERSVARLFSLLGLQLTPLMQDKKLSEALDAIAFDPFGNGVLAIECTTGALNSGGKLGKLRMRASEIAALLPAHQVQAVMVTSQDRSNLSETELQQAARDRIAVVASEEINQLISTIPAADPTRAVSFVKTLIPDLPRILQGLSGGGGLTGRYR
jgi:hypothetical protein